MNKKRLSYSFTIVLIIVSCAFTYLLNEFFSHKISEATTKSISVIEYSSGHYKMERLRGYKLIRPLVFAEPTEESSKYSGIKSKLTTYIEKLKNSQKLISASVYLRDFDQGEWMSLNDTETYYPGSLIKVPGLITYLKMAEKNPQILNKQLVFTASSNKTIPNQTFGSKQIESGKEYTIRQLLKYMITYSDNDATYLLNRNVDLAVFQQVFTDLNIPPFTKSHLTVTAKNYSVFFKVLFNGSYLTRDNSEFAMELLEGCDFKLGMVKGLPVNTIIAHKFGEMGDSTTRQLHESGLIYVNNNPYLLTIMTKGYNIKDLPEILSTISKMVYDDFVSKATN